MTPVEGFESGRQHTATGQRDRLIAVPRATAGVAVRVHVLVEDSTSRSLVTDALTADPRFQVISEAPGSAAIPALMPGARCIIADDAGIRPWLNLSTHGTALVALTQSAAPAPWAVEADGVLDASDLHAGTVQRVAWEAAQLRRLAAALDDATENRQLAFEATACGMALVSSDLLTFGTVIEANGALATLLGLTIAELRGRHLDDFLERVDPDDDGRFDDVLAGRRDRATGPRRMLTAQADPIRGQLTAAPAWTARGENRGVVLSVTSAPTELQEDLDTLRDLLHAAPFAVAALDIHGRCVTANPAWATLFGLGADELGSRAWIDGIVPEDRAAAETALLRSSHSSGEELPLTGIRPDGSRFTLQSVLVPRRDAHGAWLGFLAFGHEAHRDQPVATPAAGVTVAQPASYASGDLVTPGVAARALGVSSSTVRRWIDEGRLEASRTPGGHRRVSRAEVRQAARTAAAPPRLTSTPLPECPLPQLTRVLTTSASNLLSTAAKLTYRKGYPGWFAEQRATDPLYTWLARTARAVGAGHHQNAIDTTTTMFREARAVATLAECELFIEKLFPLILRDLQQTTDGQAEFADSRIVLIAMRRALAASEDARTEAPSAGSGTTEPGSPPCS